MYLSAVIINIVAISFPFISMIVYAKLLLDIFCYRTIRKSSDLSLFYIKFGLDLVLSIISFLKLVVYGLSMTPFQSYFLANHYLTFAVVWPVNLLTATRGILLLFIAIDRIIATYFPIMFYEYRKYLPIILSVSILLLYSIVDTLIAFAYCKPNLALPSTCINAMGILGSCYQTYSLRFQQICYSLIFLLTLLLAVKLLFTWNKNKNQTANQDLKRANYLAFLDCGIIVVFDLIPPIIHSLYPNYFDYVGAINTVAQTLGFKTIHKSSDLSLFYVKFGMDFVLSVISFVKLIMYGLAMTPLLDFFLVNHWLTYSIILPVSMLTATRGILLSFIAMDRIIATCFPIMFFKYRKVVPTVLIVGFVLTFSLVDICVAFISCKPKLDLPTECTNAMCVLGPCYQNYSLAFQQVCYSLISFLTLLLAIRLLIWNKLKNQSVNRELRRANRLAFIDAGIIVCFDLIPPIAHTVYPDFFDYVGAINSVAQTLGFVVEAYLTTINLQKNQSKTGNSTGHMFNKSGVANSSGVF